MERQLRISNCGLRIWDVIEHRAKDSWQEADDGGQQVELRGQMSEVRFKADL